MSKSKVESYKELTILVGSWNVNGKLEESEKLKSWLGTENESKKPDLVVVGLQELIELSATNIILSEHMDALSKDASDKWNSLIQNSLNKSIFPNMKNVSYCKVESQHLVGLNLTIFVTKDLRPYISDVQAAVVRRGVGGLGNKGAVCIRMQVYNTRVCFVCSHLTAHQHLTMKRNEDVEAILTEMIFSQTNTSVESRDSSKSLGETSIVQYFHHNEMSNNRIESKASKLYAGLDGLLKKHSDKNCTHENCTSQSDDIFKFSVHDHDVIIWCGDLNYRLELGPSLAEVYEMIDRNEVTYLLQIDQLNIERAAGRVFMGFHEGFITFPPTYQYIPGEGCYDDREDGKRRFPAWCDRVLWRIHKPDNSQNCDASNSEPESMEKVELLSYAVSNSNIISDHKPISALLKLWAKSTDVVELEKNLLLEGSRLLKRVMERRVSFAPATVQFKADDDMTCKVCLVNSSGIATTFSFDAAFMPSWLIIRPLSGAMSTVDSSVEITLTVDPSQLPNFRASDVDAAKEPQAAPSAHAKFTRSVSRILALPRQLSFIKRSSSASIASSVSGVHSKHGSATVVLVCNLNNDRKVFLPVALTSLV